MCGHTRASILKISQHSVHLFLLMPNDLQRETCIKTLGLSLGFKHILILVYILYRPCKHTCLSKKGNLAECNHLVPSVEAFGSTYNPCAGHSALDLPTAYFFPSMQAIV